MEMGWYSNAPTANRIQNTGTIMACAERLEVNQNILQSVDQFSSDQITRGNWLTAQAFSVQGASSSLGVQLQQAVGELNTFRREAGALNAELSEHIDTFIHIVQQFSVPRAARQLNMSGKDMARAAENMTAHSLRNLFTLQEMREDSIAQSIRTIDRADAILNPSNNSRAALTLPDMAFRNS
jgi:hypothetical protein